MTRKILGLTEPIKVFGTKSKKVIARIDTGATKSSIDAKLAAELNLGPIIRTKLVKSSHGTSIRPIIKAKISILGEELVEEFTIADRTHMKYQVLIGQNILKHNFLIDPQK